MTASDTGRGKSRPAPPGHKARSRDAGPANGRRARSEALYVDLERINDRPKPFEVYTANELWADEHTSEQMLAFHLNGEVDISSRRSEFIEESVAWMAARFNVAAGQRVIDFGCGPGLYTSRLAKLGATVCGVDFSPRSIQYARNKAGQGGLQIAYYNANYLEFQPDGDFDLVTLIMCDFCALSPAQRSSLLRKFGQILAPSGRVVLDVYSLSAFEQREESSIYKQNLTGGFWSPNPHYEFLNTFKYESEKVALDKYTIIEPDRLRVVNNWFQYFSVEMLQQEFSAAGLEVEEIFGDVAGHPFKARQPEFAVVSKKS